MLLLVLSPDGAVMSQASVRSVERPARTQLASYHECHLGNNGVINSHGARMGQREDKY